MKAKICGGYSFQSKKGSDLTSLTVTDERLNCVGVTCINIMCSTDSLPDKLENMIKKEYLIDVRYGQNGSMFAQSFYEVK